MREIRIHGRGGQGAVTAGIILAQALFNEGKHVQTFPIFGVERRGAPVAAYVREGNSEILQRYNIYKPNDIIVLDEALLDVVDIYEGWRGSLNGLVLINGEQREVNENIHFINAKRIAWDHNLGSKQAPVVNTIMIGAYLALRKASLESALKAVEAHVPIKINENKQALIDGYQEIVDRGGLL